MEFEWDEEKAVKNWKKHRISFETAKLIFNDPYRIEYLDDIHSDSEDRWISIGLVGKLLCVIYTERDGGNKIRLISARLATAKERREYYGSN